MSNLIDWANYLTHGYFDAINVLSTNRGASLPCYIALVRAKGVHGNKKPI
jgi:hypothetical protein